MCLCLRRHTMSPHPRRFSLLPPSQTADNLVPLRHAELKHGRLAMLAALGWPAQEYFHPLIVEKLHDLKLRVVNTLADGCSPSVLNGGLSRPEVRRAEVPGGMG